MSDLIKRSDAIKALEREKSDWNNDYNVPIDNCIKRLKKVKSADTDISEYSDKLWRNAYERGKADRPQDDEFENFDRESLLFLIDVQKERIGELLADRPQGEWLVDILNYKSMCSVCGANETDFIYGTEMWYGLGESKFCPSCGARMKGADDETAND